MASSRSFTAQLRASRVTFIAITAFIFVLAAYLAASLIAASSGRWTVGYWVTVGLFLMLVIPYIWMTRLLWRQMSRQQPLAPIADQLRAATQEIPSGHSRIYVDREHGLAVHCTPRWRGADHFSRLELDDVEALDRAEPGGLVGLPATTYRVMQRPATVWRDVWVDSAVRGDEEGQFHSTRTHSRSGLGARLKVFLFNHKTGVLTPDAVELGEVAHVVTSPDRTRDVPTAGKAG